MLTVIDYGRGNLFSIAQALTHLGVPHVIGRTPETIASASALLLPGVGAFGDAMQALAAQGLVTPIREAVQEGRSLVGICLGMQLLASRSLEFGDHAGLDLIPGTVEPLAADPVHGARVPNVGWRELQGADEAGWAYFVHSYALRPRDATVVVATTRHGDVDVPAIVHHGRVWGFQFHPEKSGPYGLRLLARALGVAPPPAIALDP